MRALVVLMLVCGVAHAEPPGLTPPVPVEVQAPPKSVATAMWLSLGTTLGGLVLSAIGSSMQGSASCGNGCEPGSALSLVGDVAFLVGPSLGHAYAGHTWNTGLAMRVGGLVSFGLGMIVVLPCAVGGTGDSGSCTAGVVAATGGAVALLAGTVVEIATVPGAVHDYNRAHAAPVVTFAPVATPRGLAPGVAIAGRF